MTVNTHPQNRIGKWALLAVALFSLAVIMGLFGCSPSKRIARIAANHPGSLAGPCAQFYPVRVIDSTRIEYRQGSTLYDTAWVSVDCDSVVKYRTVRVPGATNTAVVRLPCPPSTHRVDTVTVDKFKQIENTAKVEMLTQERDKAIARAERLEGGRNVWRWIAIALIAYTVGRVVLRMYTRVRLP